MDSITAGKMGKTYRGGDAREEKIAKLRRMADWMDSRFKIPGTDIRFGLDSLLGLIPGVGDTVTLASTAYLLGMAKSLGVPKHAVALMIWNAFIDWFIGLIPFLGDIFDIGWKANKKNVSIILKHMDE